MIVPSLGRKNKRHISTLQSQGTGREADLESGGGVGLHDFADVTGQLRERSANLTMSYDERTGNVRLG